MKRIRSGAGGPAAAAADRRAGSVADAERGPGRDHRAVRPARRDRGAGCGGRPGQQRDRGSGAGELLAGIAAAQLAGEDFLTGLDRQRADAAGQQITPVPGLASTTAAGLARRITPAQWEAVERGLAVVTSRMLSLLPALRAAARHGRSRSTWTPRMWRFLPTSPLCRVQCVCPARWAD